MQRNKEKKKSCYRNTPSVRKKPERLQIHAHHLQLRCRVLPHPVGRFKQFSAYEKNKQKKKNREIRWFRARRSAKDKRHLNGFSDSHSGISGERDSSQKERNPTEVELRIARPLGYTQAACFLFLICKISRKWLLIGSANFLKIALSKQTNEKRQIPTCGI